MWLVWKMKTTITSLGAILLVATALASTEAQSKNETAPVQLSGSTMEAPIMMKSPDLDWAHQIHISLPASYSLGSSPALMAETLQMRQYPSLKVSMRIFPGKDHYMVMPDIISSGIQTLWADDVASATVPAQ
jgi:hypothetical protein